MWVTPIINLSKKVKNLTIENLGDLPEEDKVKN